MTLVCTQCGRPKPQSDWKICGDCWHKNIKYRSECDALAMAFHREFQVRPPSVSRDTIYHRFSEMRDRRARHAIVSSHQLEEDE